MLNKDLEERVEKRTERLRRELTERKRADDALRESEARYRELFEHSPIGVWEEDYSGAKRIVDRLRKKGVRDFRRYFREHPGVLSQIANAIKIIDVNPALVDIYRAPDKETFVQWDEDPAKTDPWMSFYEQELAALAAGESRFALEYAGKAVDGSEIVIRSITNIGAAYKDSWARVVSTAEDITERKQTDDAMRESEERHRELFELSPIGIWEEDYSGAKRMIDRLRRKGVRDFRRYFRKHPEVLRQMAQAIKIIDVNPALLDIYRASDKETYLRAEAGSARIDEWCRFYERELAALAEGESRVVLEYPDKAYDGSDIVTRTITHIGEAYKDSWARVVSTVEDITERKRADDALRESEVRYRELFEQSPIGIWEEDYSGAKRMIDCLRKKGVRDFRRYFREHPEVLSQIANAIKIIDVNPALVDIYRAPDKETFVQWDEDPAKTDPWMSFYEQGLAALAAGEDRVALEHADKTFDGSDIVLRIITSVGEAHKDSWARLVSTVEDITERKRADDAVRESEQRHRDLFEQSPIGIWEEDYSGAKRIVDRLSKKGVRDFRRYFREHPRVLRQMAKAVKVIDVNQALVDIYRAPDKETFVQWDENPASIDSWISFYEQGLVALAEGESRVVREHPDKAFDGSDIVLRIITSVGEAHKDSWARVVSTTEDITERRRADDALRESESRYRDLFEHSPIGIWEEDYSAAKRMIDRLRRKGVRDFRRYFREHPKVLRQIAQAIKDIDVNPVLLDIYRAPDKETFLRAEDTPARIDHWMDVHEKELSALAEGESRVVLEYPDKAYDGSDIVIRTITHIGEAYKDSWTRVVSTAEDITERRRADDALRESEARHRELFEHSPIGIWEEDYSGAKRIIDRLRSKGVRNFRRYFRKHPEVLRQMAQAIKVIDVNRALVDIYRASNKEAYLQAVTDSSRIEQWCRFYERELAALAAGEGRVVVEHPDKAYDGSDIVTRTITHIGEAYKDSWARVISTAEDITERRRAEEELHARARQQAAVAQLGHKALSGVSMPVLMDEAVNLVGQTLNVEFCKVLELLPDGDVFLLRAGVGWKKGLVGKATVPTAAESQAGYTLLSSGPVVVEDLRTETRFSGPQLLKDHDVVSGLSVMIHGQKQPFGVLGAHTTRHRRFTPNDVNFVQAVANVLADAIEQKRAEDTLRESEERFRSLATNLPGTVFQRRLTSDGRLVFAYVSPGARDLYGVEPEDMLADPSAFLDTLAAEDRDRYLAALRHSARTLSPMDLELRVVSAGGGATRWMRTISRPSRRESGEVVWGGVAIDITEQKQVEAQLIQASKLSALGVLAANLVHELNQPLNIIRMAADSSLMLLEEGEADLDYQGNQLALIGSQTQRMADIIDHILIFSRKDEAESELFNPAATVRNAVRLVKDEMRLDGVRISAKLPRSCRPVLGHRVQLEQVMVNLFTNAKDAILAHPAASMGKSPTNSRGKIEVDVVDDTARDQVLITVSDTGGGIPKDVIDHLFEPFVTTKEVGKGTGLGLSVAYGIITDMDGRIEARNTAVGARFLITLPVAGDERSKTKKLSMRPEKIKA